MYHAESVKACKETMTINTYSITIKDNEFDAHLNNDIKLQ